MVTIKPTTAALRSFFMAGTRMSVSKGDYIIRPEETPSGVFFIEEGFVKAANTTKYGEENLLVIRKESEIFPLIWVVTGDNRNVGYIAHTDCVVYRRTQEELEEMAAGSTDALKEILLVTTTMYQSQAERVNSLVYRTVRERIAYFIKTLARRFGKPHPDGVLIDLPVTRHDIASSVSATRETVSREFSAFMRRGILKQVEGKILVTNMDELDDML